jgi:hypothetical protein
MESRAKQRLTGAIILVALFVLLVPELLTGPRDSHPATDSPSGEGMRRYTIDLDAQNSAGQPVAPEGNEAPVALPEVAPTPAASTGRALPGEEATAPAESEVATNPAPAPNTAVATAPPPVAIAPRPLRLPRSPPPRLLVLKQRTWLPPLRPAAASWCNSAASAARTTRSAWCAT